MTVSKTVSVRSCTGLYSHSLQRIINRLRFFAHTLASIRGLCLELCNAGALTFFQPLGIHGQESSRRLRSERCDLEVLDSRNGDDVVVAIIAGGGRARVDRYKVEDWAGGEEGAFEGLRLRSGGGELDAGRMVLACVPHRILTRAEAKG